VLLLDGPNDVMFVETFLPQAAKKFKLVSTEGLTLSTHTTNFFARFAQSHQFLLLHDREFFPQVCMDCRLQKERKILNVPVFYWCLPCIESYLILHEFLTLPLDEAQELAIDYLWNLEHGTLYDRCARVGVKEWKQTTSQIVAPWNSALRQVTQPNPDWMIIVQVIHGHTWLKGRMQTTAARITQLSSENLHPIVQALLDTIETAIVSAL